VTRVVRQVGEGPEVGPRAVRIARSGRVEDAAPVRAAVAAADALRVARQLAVLEGADHVHAVRQTLRRVDVLVVPALRPAEVVRGEEWARRALRRQLLPAV